MKDIQATGEAFSPQNGTSNTSQNIKFFLPFYIFVGNFADPDPADQNQCGSGSTTLCFFLLSMVLLCNTVFFYFTNNGTAPYFEIDNIYIYLLTARGPRVFYNFFYELLYRKK
jgi:hypothetical protein